MMKLTHWLRLIYWRHDIREFDSPADVAADCFNSNWRPRFVITGNLNADSTWEIAPNLAHRFWWESLHFVLCWLVWLPHLQTMQPDGRVWFRRRWLVRLALGKWKFQLNWHRYPIGSDKPEAFGCHCHPLNTFSFIYKGGYDHLRKPGLRNGITGLSFIERVGPRWRWWWKMSADDGHRVERMKPDTQSIFLMWGEPKDWWFEGGETKGSSRILRYTKEDE